MFLAEGKSVLEESRFFIFKHKYNSFSNYPEFALLESIDNKKGQWKSNWSRVVRVFKCTID